ncbi:hypothetical protein BC830DRAFT_1245888 [Chytriomyces sp. MP71]|nr:hypothetical protein BC830DRAFT_1245888 [Chytriomyces sp. MP71]
MAPELVLDSRCRVESDVWSLACLIFSIFNHGTSPVAANDNLHTYRTIISRMNTQVDLTKNVPPRLVDSLHLMLAQDPASRITLASFQTSEFFDNILVSTIGFLESFVGKNQISKAQFLKGLVGMLPQFSIKLVHRKILPTLLAELKDPLMTPFVLPNIFWICEQSSDEDFMLRILPSLKGVFKLTEPPQAILLLLSRMDIFIKKVPQVDTFKQDILPLLTSSLASASPVVQEQAIKATPAVIPLLDFTSLKTLLLPHISAAYLSSSTIGIRIACLISLHGMVKALDRHTLVDTVLPLLKSGVVKEPGVLLALCAVYEEMGRCLEKDVTASLVLPEVWKMAMEGCLNVKQFKRFMKVIKDLSTKVEELQIKYLEERTSLDAPIGPGVRGESFQQSHPQSTQQDFATLVSGKKDAFARNVSSSLPAMASHEVDGWVEFDAPAVAKFPTKPIDWATSQPAQPLSFGASLPMNVSPNGSNSTFNSSNRDWPAKEKAPSEINSAGFVATFPQISPALAPPPSASFARPAVQHKPSLGQFQVPIQSSPMGFPTSGGWRSGIGAANMANGGGTVMTPMGAGTGIMRPSGSSVGSAAAAMGQGATKRNSKLDEFDPFG